MPHFFFDIDNGENSTHDDTGLACERWGDVSRHAIGTLAEIADAELPDSTDRDFVVEVRDEEGQPVFRASLELRSAWMLPGLDDPEGPIG